MFLTWPTAVSLSFSLPPLPLLLCPQALVSCHSRPICLHEHFCRQVLSSGSKQLPFPPGWSYYQEATLAAEESFILQR